MRGHVVQTWAEELNKEPEDLPADVRDVQPGCVFQCSGIRGLDFLCNGFRMLHRPFEERADA